MAHRPDLSDHIVHLTRNGPKPARDNLVSILADQCIEARNPYGIAVAHLKKIACGKSEFLDCQKVTCFSEVPLDYLPGLLDPGVTRNITLQPYGVVFDRSYLIDRGACQVWYANTYPGNKKFKWSANNVNSLIDEAAIYEEGNPDPERWENSAIAQLTPFWETIGQWWKASYFGKEPFLMTKDFAFEREWRYRGSFEFALDDVAVVVAPPKEWDGIREALVEAGISEAGVKSLDFYPLERPRKPLAAALTASGPAS